MKSVHNFLTVCIVCTACLISNSCYTEKQLSISTSLKDQSTKWEVQVHKGLFGFGRASFGSYHTISVEKLDSPKYKNKSVDPGLLIFRRSVTKEYRKFYHVFAGSENDTTELFFSVLHSTVDERPSLLKRLRGKDKPEEYTSESLPKTASGSIMPGKNASEWKFEIKWFPPRLGYSASLTERYLTNGQDTFYAVVPGIAIDSRKSVVTTYDFQSAFVSGFVLQNNQKEDIAAIQFVGKKQVWINQSLTKETQMAIAALFIMMIGSAGL